MLRKLYLFISVIFLANVSAFAQTTALKVTVIDASNNETIPFAAVVVKFNKSIQGSGQADINGDVTIKPLNPGVYTVEASYLGFAPVQVNNVDIREGKTTYLDIKLKPSVQEIKEFTKVEHVVPLIDKNKTVNVQTIDRKTFRALGDRNLAAVVSLSGGVYQAERGGISVRGGRSGTTTIFIDGQRTMGSSSVPQSMIEQVSTMVSGLPAEFGDLTSGGISITTRPPGLKYFGGVEVTSSQITDAYKYNYINFSTGGPILYNKDKENKRTILGFSFGGEATTDKDNSPSFGGNWKVKDDVAKVIERNPYKINPTGGVLRSAEFLRKEDFELVAARQNARTNEVTLNGKLDFAPNKMLTVTLGGSYNYSNGKGYLRNNSLLNPNASQLISGSTTRVWGRIRQRFGAQGNNDKSVSNIKNAFYQLQVSYTVDEGRNENENHRDNLQDYGYIGKFKTYKSDFWARGVDKKLNREVYQLKSHDFDTLVVFTPDTVTNPLLVRYTQNYMDLTKGLGARGNYDNPQNISSNGGLLNGDADNNNPALRVYNLWYNTGQTPDGYGKYYNTQFGVNGSFSADIKNHAIKVGFEIEQRVQSNYSISPAALWKRAWQLSNNHITQLDLDNPHIISNGSNGLLDSVNYDRKFEEAKYVGFTKNIREALGVDSKEYIQIHDLDKDQLKLSMFTADNLMLGGSGTENLLGSYYGYDIYGNRLKGKDSNIKLQDFWDAKNSNGDNTRAVGAFKPIYIAGYIQDNFDFRDIKFNAGLRIDRYDANQKVLKDQYSFYETKKAAEITAEHPDFIKNDGQNYVVYGDNINSKNLTQIYGYRNIETNKWFDGKGNPLQDPKVLADKAGGTILPVLAEPEDTSAINIKHSKFDSDKSFTDYKAQVNLMPRLAFSFPISDQANFFAHYDVLTQRPSTNRMDPTDYYFLQNNSQSPISNPNLKPTRTIDYELGFQQLLNESENSALTITGFYREMRNMVQLVRIAYAYPTSYMTYGNIDFGTVKGLSFKYDLRRTKNITLMINYTLQFAEGTGSSAGDAFSVVNSGQPNLRSVIPLSMDQRHNIVCNFDYHYGSGKDYDGPKWFNTNFFENTGANLTFRAGTGTPFTKNANVSRTADLGGSSGSTKIEGSINGARLPSNFRVDARFDRTMQLNFGKKDAENRKKANLTVYVQVLNLLNTKNINGVYAATGNPNDDGYLTNFRSQAEIAQQINPQSYIDYYSMKVNAPGFYGIPRRIRIGANLDF